MNGKIKTKFAALFAVALMITVCVVPVVGNEDVQAADVSSTIPEGISDIEIQFFTEDSTDFSDMIYSANGSKLPASVDPVEWKQVGTTGCFINVNKNSEYFGKYLRFGQTGLSNDEIIKLGKDKWLPLIQTSYTYNVEGIDIEISVTKENGEINGKDVIVDTGSESLQKAGAIFDKVECVSSIKFIGTYDPSSPSICMGFTSDLISATGEYKVKVSTDGAVIASEKFTFESDADLLSIDGTITDAGTTVIEGAKVAYKIGNTAGTVVTDENGDYEIKFKKGSVVEITGITYGNGEYTFNGGYVFGTLTTPVTNGVADFKANEFTASVTIKSGSTTLSGQSVKATWYTQYQNADNTTFTISSSTNGKASIINQKSEADGIIYIAYKVPTVPTLPTGASSPCSILVVSGQNNTTFSYDIATITTGNTVTSDVPNQVTGKNGTSAATYSSGLTISDIVTKESIVQFNVKSSSTDSKNNTVGPLNIDGSNINVTWYSEKQNDNADTYKVSAVNGSIARIVNTDDGVVTVAYVTPTVTDGSSLKLVASVSSAPGYTFKTKNISTGNAVSSIENQISDYGAMGIIAGDGVTTVPTLVSKEAAFNVTGTVFVPGIMKGDDGKVTELTVSYTNGVGSSIKIDELLDTAITSEGATYPYTFQVTEGKSCVITPSMSGYKFTPTSFTTNTAKANILNVNFTAESTVVETKYNPTSDDIGSISVGVFDSGKLVVDLTYDVNGKQYTTPVLVSQVGSTTEYVASFDVAGVKGTYVELVSASAENYQFSFDEEGKLVAGSSDIMKFYLYNVLPTIPAEGVELTIFDGDDELGIIKSNAKGIATLEVPSDVSDIYAIYDGLYKLQFGSGSAISVKFTGYKAANVAEYIDDKDATVKVTYVSAYNNETISETIPAEYRAIAPGDSIGADIGDSIALKAPSIDNFEFVAWMVDGVVVSEKADYTLVVPEGGCEAVALYSAVHYEEPAEGLSMNVLVIGIVILILGILAVAYGIISKKQ